MNIIKAILKWIGILVGCAVVTLIILVVVGTQNSTTTIAESQSSLPQLTDDEKTETDQLTPSEKVEIENIKNAGNLAGKMGHEITKNTKLIIATNNFGEKLGCILSVRAYEPTLGLAHPKWNLRIQVGKGIKNMVWTANLLSDNAGEIRLLFSGERYSLANKIDGKGGRAIDLSPKLLDSLLSSGSVKAISGMVGDTELSNTYDLSGFRKAYKYSEAICL